METKFNFNSQICTSRNKGGGVIKHHKVYALKGNELYEFDSVPEAAEKTGCWKDKIYKCCNGKLAYTGGYVWSYKPLDIPTEVEEWRDVKGYENLYQVSRKGKVRSSHKGYWEVLTSVVNRYGYNQYLFHKDGKRKNMRGNRLVAEAYIPNPDNFPFVNHKDENPANDCVENLEWCTAEYNANYGTLKERQSKNNIKNRPVCMFDVDGTFIREFYNVNDAAKYVGGNHPCVSRACSGQSVTYKKKIWCYKGDEDMCHRTNGMGIYFITALNPLDNPNDIPAWSLHRLIEMMPLDVIPEGGFDNCFTLIKNYPKGYSVEYDGFSYYHKENIYDTIIEGIEHLIKEGYFNKEYLEK